MNCGTVIAYYGLNSKYYWDNTFSVDNDFSGNHDWCNYRLGCVVLVITDRLAPETQSSTFEENLADNLGDRVHTFRLLGQNQNQYRYKKKLLLACKIL